MKCMNTWICSEIEIEEIKKVQIFRRENCDSSDELPAGCFYFDSRDKPYTHQRLFDLTLDGWSITEIVEWRNSNHSPAMEDEMTIVYLRWHMINVQLNFT